jgi:hypothetical protein
MDPNSPEAIKAREDDVEYLTFLRSPEYQLRGKLKTFDMSLEIFEGNFTELICNIDAFRPTAQKELMRWATDPAFRNTQQITVTRMLHNFMASASSLIDHARKFYRDMYEAGGTMPLYQPKINETFGKDGLSQFIVGFRQYCVHYRSPVITFTMSTHMHDTISSVPTLSRDALIAYHGWNAVATKFLKASPAVIDLVSVVTEYRGKVRNFYGWFKSEQARIHRVELEYITRMDIMFNESP